MVCFVVVLLIPFQVVAMTLPERISQFIDLFDYNKAIDSYDVRNLQTDFPTKLLSPEYMLPQTAKYPLKDIQQVYQLSTDCTGTLPVSPLVTEPLVFVRAICRGTPLTAKWFARSGLIHPGGGTYAQRYVNDYPENFEQLRSYMHIKERPIAEVDTLLGKLQRMRYDAIFALIAGERMFVDNDDLWLKRGSKYYIFPQDVWQENVIKSEMKFSIVDKDVYCFVKRGNLCWELSDQSDLVMQSMIALIVINITLVIGWTIYRWNVKRDELKNRMLVLQILTHELRTPIASLSLTVEGFRREFERLPETVYDEFRRLCEDTRRLRQLAEASKDYLQSEHHNLATEWIPSVEEWLGYRYEESKIPVTLAVKQDIAVKVNVYWLGTCLDNLINNAKKYGVEPIQLRVDSQDNSVVFSVIDQGNLTKRDWKTVKKPFVSKAGLGLGLTIVESMVGRMGGTMTLIGPPTTFKLEIPCETDTATR
ncbi:sensor histidine kinase VxrA [Vibrio sp. TH_r3]|uniref:sensor histidine kinase VxrA n=1 Tax=Vibrio sp. TH_r3 TaxID=3082084 RepID=UPI0029541970|nr:sensor histidine kinase VxrA [Vibrio sp. TH_r3]MDV7103509.1 sensor histidine kinase VxrA [Vibrio sp. TH_r3]